MVLADRLLITSSAMASSVSEMVRSGTFAVLKLTKNSNLGRL